jgi:hypothetical protein
VQAQSIDSTLEDLKLVDHGVGNQVKTYCTHDGKMNQDEGGKEFDCSWGYKSVIGNLNYLEKFIRGNIVISVHPCSQYLSQPMKFYDEAANQSGRCLLRTWDKGFIVWLDAQQSFECYFDADPCVNRDPMYSEDPNSAKRRMGCVIMYCGCPVLWALRLQSAFSISTMDS